MFTIKLNIKYKTHCLVYLVIIFHFKPISYFFCIIFFIIKKNTYSSPFLLMRKFYYLQSILFSRLFRNRQYQSLRSNLYVIFISQKLLIFKFKNNKFNYYNCQLIIQFLDFCSQYLCLLQFLFYLKSFLNFKHYLFIFKNFLV